MNNKGFATSFIIFGLLVLFLVVMGILVFTLNNSSKLNNKIKTQVIDNIEDTFEGNSRKVKAIDIYYDKGEKNIDCTDLQCVLDEIKQMIE